MPRRLFALVVMFGMVAASCATTGESECSRVVSETLAADSGVHVIPGADIDYATDPPTSGPHSPGPEPGVYSRELSGPEQVGVLERGDVLVQFDPDSTGVESLAALVDDDVVLAPNDRVGSSVVLTSWLHRMECSGSGDLAPMATFIAEQKDSGPTPHD